MGLWMYVCTLYRYLGVEGEVWSTTLDHLVLMARIAMMRRLLPIEGWATNE
jgi:hypothetical protein